MIIDIDHIILAIKNKKYWYFGNHSKNFVKMCYLVDLISNAGPNATQKDLDLLRERFNLRSNIKLEASMFKSMISSKVFGLLDPTNRDYVKCEPTAAFYAIKERVNGNYEKVNDYLDLIEQQIEKVYCITPLFETKSKEEFQLYPLFLLYKVLIEIGELTGKYEISDLEFNYFVSTSYKYEQWRDVVETILYYRTMDNMQSFVEEKLKTHQTTPPDQRYYQLISHIRLLKLVPASGKPQVYKIPTNSVDEVIKKVHAFENALATNAEAVPNGLTNFSTYIKLLGSNRSILQTTITEVDLLISKGLMTKANKYTTEGKEVYKLHKKRERDPRIIKAAKEKQKRQYGKLFCEICKFSFEESYGTIGENFIEGHHKKPLSAYSEYGDQTEVEDICLVCSNCHSMIHSQKPMLTIEELRKVIKK
ncbi:HNH endonuclease [Bacillus sp. Marseille-P3661]|uniref:HNH endonuclease n=1 Tax=Bacillus sp. Marseille-P3661 TaxID=1936234 RepID=UPI0015E181A7|nr:HNH endonuclease [Bacillus sp. Marseille-P3661]